MAEPIDSINIDQLTKLVFNGKGGAQIDHFALDIGGSLAKLAYQKKVKIKKISLRDSSDCLHSDSSSNSRNELYEYFEEEVEQLRLSFVKFETRYLETCLDFIRENILTNYPEENGIRQGPNVKVTGGGAYKYKNMIEEKLYGLKVDKVDEMECLLKGSIFLLQNIPDEVFTYDKHCSPEYNFSMSCLVNPFPFLLVNIGSGVSIIKVSSERDFVRVGGTSLGGGTFWGIGSILTNGLGFDELLALSDEGDHRKVDMLVRDIYGGDYTSLGLSGDVIASSFGLAARNTNPKTTFHPPDLLKSLLITISNNIGQIAYMHANLHSLKRIIFGGFFIRGHAATMHTLSYAIHFWSKGTMDALFLRHEGYLGAIGAYLKTVDANEEFLLPNSGLVISPLHKDVSSPHSGISWMENYFGSSKTSIKQSRSISNASVEKCATLLLEIRAEEFLKKRSLSASPTNRNFFSVDEGESSNISGDIPAYLNVQSPRSPTSSTIPRFDKLELERLHDILEPFPLLTFPSKYIPDTWDLTQDSASRDYWLNCFEEGVDKHCERAYESQQFSSANARERADGFREKYTAFLRELRENPSAYGVLTVRCILDGQENYLRQFGFADPFFQQKKIENEMALSLLVKRFEYLDQLPWDNKHLELVVGLLAGNIFDWGAQAVMEFILDKSSHDSGFELAKLKIQKRPWLIDSFDLWMQRLEQPMKYKDVLIFCDNSGFDVLMGVLPFALEFCNNGSRVTLIANSGPALNDVTCGELRILIRKVAKIIPLAKKLQVCDNGQSSPCLDLRTVSSALVKACNEAISAASSPKEILIVIVGMGRAIHTNLRAQFNCDALKVAVIKNAWLAKDLGGDLYSVVFSYEPAVDSVK